MITINKGLTNSVVLRLNDLTTLQDPIFLFELTCVQSNQVFLFTAEDTSTTSRYNNFNIFEVSGTNAALAPTASVPRIQLEFGGSYLYKVYQSDNYNLEPTDIVLDWGKALFINGEYQSFFFELDDDAELGVFDDWDELGSFDEDELETLGIFDPELRPGGFILTEDGFDLITEDGYNLVWN